MPLKWIVSVLLMTSYTEAVMLQREFDIRHNSTVCGDQITIICTAKSTNFITISVEGHGSHTFERNSEKEAILGPFNLNLTKADVHPDNFFLTLFEVASVTNQQYFVQVPQVHCSDVQSSDSLSVEIKSEIDSPEHQVLEINRTDDDILLQWKHPNSFGWKNQVSHYSIHLHANEKTLAHNCGNNTDFLVTNASSATVVNISATNFCMETAVIKTYTIIVHKKEEDTDGLLERNQVAVFAGITLGGTAMIVLVIVIGTALVCCLRIRKKCRSYNPAFQEKKAGVRTLKLSSCENVPISDNTSFTSDQETDDVRMDFITRCEENSEVNNPCGIVVTNDRVIITDKDNNKCGTDIVRVFNKNFQHLFIIDGPFKKLKGISTDKCNCIYVADCGNNRIVKFLPEGAYNQQTYPSKSDDKFHPHGIVVDNDLLFVCDPRNSCIIILDLDLQWKYKVETQYPKAIFTPEHIAHNPRDSVFFVLQEGTHEVLKIYIDTTTMLCTAQGYRKTVGHNVVKSVTICENQVVVADTNERVLYFTSELECVEEKHIEGSCIAAAYNGRIFYCARKKRKDGIFWSENMSTTSIEPLVT